MHSLAHHPPPQLSPELARFVMTGEITLALTHENRHTLTTHSHAQTQIPIEHTQRTHSRAITHAHTHSPSTTTAVPGPCPLGHGWRDHPRGGSADACNTHSQHTVTHTNLLQHTLLYYNTCNTKTHTEHTHT